MSKSSFYKNITAVAQFKHLSVLLLSSSLLCASCASYIDVSPELLDPKTAYKQIQTGDRAGCAGDSLYIVTRDGKEFDLLACGVNKDFVKGCKDGPFASPVTIYFRDVKTISRIKSQGIFACGPSYKEKGVAP